MLCVGLLRYLQRRELRAEPRIQRERHSLRGQYYFSRRLVDRRDQCGITRPAELGFWRRFALWGDLIVSGYLQLTSAAPFQINESGSFSTTYEVDNYESSSVFGIIPTGSLLVSNSYTASSYSTGFNADTDFDLQYSDTTSEDGILTLVSAPEPSTVVLFSGVLALLALRRFRMRRVEPSERR
jgi:hypothetical protein